MSDDPWARYASPDADGAAPKASDAPAPDAPTAPSADPWALEYHAPGRAIGNASGFRVRSELAAGVIL